MNTTGYKKPSPPNLKTRVIKIFRDLPGQGYWFLELSFFQPLTVERVLPRKVTRNVAQNLFDNHSNETTLTILRPEKHSSSLGYA